MHKPRDKSDIRFETKEESNARREREFLALSPWERLRSYLRDIALQADPKSSPGKDKGNFMIERRRDGVRS
jgi:hypothetical protein